MKKLFIPLILFISLVITAAFTTSAQAVDPQPVGPGGTWTQVFGDEFEGTTLDSTKWDPFWFLEGGVINDVPTKASNVSLVNGKVFLRLYNGNGTQAVSGAAITTSHRAGRYQVQVGDFIEAKIMFAGSATEDVYNWPAFWITGKTWPEDGEHDIAEGLGGTLKTVYHRADALGNHVQGAKTTPAGDWGGAFHTYGIHRQATQAVVYWDGVPVHTYATDDTGLGEQVVLNVGKPRNDPRPLQFNNANGVRVEYVRAWRQP